MLKTIDSSAAEVLPPQVVTTMLTSTSKGAALMRSAADKVLNENAEQVARAMLESCLKGHILSARFLYDLAEGLRQLSPEDADKLRRSQAEQWDRETQWVSENNEEGAETAIGSREPEQ